jgi:hypothetical protein
VLPPNKFEVGAVVLLLSDSLFVAPNTPRPGILGAASCLFSYGFEPKSEGYYP